MPTFSPNFVCKLRVIIKTAKIIKKATSSFADEAQDFRYGPPALEMLVKFVNKFPESGQYKRLDTRVFIMMACDKERALEEANKLNENEMSKSAFNFLPKF